MASAAEKKRLLGGMSAGNARKKLLAVWAENHSIPFTRVSRIFAREHGITLFALCELWHSLRVKNKSVEIMIASFAQTVLTKNALIAKLSATIHLQRERLATLERPAGPADNAAEAEKGGAH